MDNHDYFEEEYQTFRASSMYATLERKFLPVPYWKKYRIVRFITLIASYLFNILSGVTAASLVYFFLLDLTNEWVAFTGTLTTIALLEVFKRKLSSLTFKEYLMNRVVLVLPTLLLILFSCLSISSSYFGSKEMVFQFSPTAPITTLENATTDLDRQILDVDEQIEEARNTRWLGTTTSESQATITSLNNQKEALLLEKIRVREKTDKANGVIEKSYSQEINIQANHFAFITLFLELLFLVSAFYLQYYDFRSYIEFHKPLLTVATEESKEEPLLLERKKSEETSVATVAIPPDIIIGAIKNAKSNLSAFQSKIKKGQGSEASNNRGIECWQQKLEELEKLLPKNGVGKHP